MNLPEKTPSPTNQSLVRSTEVLKLSPVTQLLRAKESNVLTNPITACITIEQAQRGPSLAVIRSTYGTDMSVAYLSVLFREAIRHFNHSVDSDALVGYSRRVLVDYYWWRMEDFALCLNRGVSGQYGHNMARWTYGDTFLTWAEGYESERVQYHQQKNVNKKHEDNRNLEISPSIFTDEVKNMFEKKHVETKIKETKRHNEVDGYMEEFDNLWRLQNPGGKGMRFVEFEGKRVDLTEYINIRVCSSLK